MNETADCGRPISEEELSAYIDGWLDVERQSRVDRILRTSPDLAERVASYRVQRDCLRAAFSATGREPIPPRLNLSRLVEIRLAKLSRPWCVAAAVAFAFGLGGTIGWCITSRPSREIDRSN